MFGYIDVFTRMVTLGRHQVVGSEDGAELAFSIAAYRVISGVSEVVARLRYRFEQWKLRRSTMHALSMLDDRLLADIGIDRWRIAEVTEALVESVVIAPRESRDRDEGALIA